MKGRGLNFKKIGIGTRLKNLISLIAVGYFLTACAFGTDYVKLYDPLTYKPTIEEGTRVAYAEVKEVTPILGERIWVVIKKVDDKRPDPSRIEQRKTLMGWRQGVSMSKRGSPSKKYLVKI